MKSLTVIKSPQIPSARRESISTTWFRTLGQFVLDSSSWFLELIKLLPFFNSYYLIKHSFPLLFLDVVAISSHALAASPLVSSSGRSNGREVHIAPE